MTRPAISPLLKSCHPERSRAVSEANRQAQSKDPYNRDAAAAGSFRIAIRFYDESGSERHSEASRVAAKECSPRRKPWVKKGN
jgi:hypothetical protein